MKKRSLSALLATGVIWTLSTLTENSGLASGLKIEEFFISLRPSEHVQCYGGRTSPRLLPMPTLLVADNLKPSMSLDATFFNTDEIIFSTRDMEKNCEFYDLILKDFRMIEAPAKRYTYNRFIKQLIRRGGTTEELCSKTIHEELEVTIDSILFSGNSEYDAGYVDLALCQ